MIQKLKWKFIRIAMLAISIVVILIMGASNAVHYLHIEQQAAQKMDLLVANGGMLPSGKNAIAGWLGEHVYIQKHKDDETLFEIRYYTVVLDNQGEVVSVNLRRSATQKKQDAIENAKNLWKNHKTSGYVECCKYQAVPMEDSVMYIFLNCHQGVTDSKMFLLTSFLVCVAGLLMVFLLLYVFSEKAIRPFVENMEKQKQFVTNASHELKTPLAVISANAEVLEMLHGENEWNQSIKNQINRMNYLTEELVMLSGLDENTAPETEDLNLSELVQEITDTFDPVARTQSKELAVSLEKDVRYHGNRSSIMQMLTILLDNAVKYASSDTRIECRLTGGKHPVFLIENEAEGLQVGNQDKLFDRFYRSDASRNSETGGNGIGLSIAKAIAESHKGKLKAFSRDGKRICFTVSL